MRTMDFYMGIYHYGWGQVLLTFGLGPLGLISLDPLGVELTASRKLIC